MGKDETVTRERFERLERMSHTHPQVTDHPMNKTAVYWMRRADAAEGALSELKAKLRELTNG